MLSSIQEEAFGLHGNNKVRSSTNCRVHILKALLEIVFDVVSVRNCNECLYAVRVPSTFTRKRTLLRSPVRAHICELVFLIHARVKTRSRFGSGPTLPSSSICYYCIAHTTTVRRLISPSQLLVLMSRALFHWRLSFNVLPVPS